MTITPAPTDPPEIHTKLWEGFRGHTGFDIGANTGQSIGEMSQRFKFVYSFEPAAECWPLLEQNADLFDNVTVVPMALSNVDGRVELIDIPDKIDTGQLVSKEALGMEYDPNQPDAKVRSVISERLDTFVDSTAIRPDFLKIDVEGHELLVIDGAAETIRKYKPSLLIEIHSTFLGNAIRKLLEGLDYDIETVRHPHYTASRGLQHMYDVHYWLKCHYLG